MARPTDNHESSENRRLTILLDQTEKGTLGTNAEKLTYDEFQRHYEKDPGRLWEVLAIIEKRHIKETNDALDLVDQGESKIEELTQENIEKNRQIAKLSVELDHVRASEPRAGIEELNQLRTELTQVRAERDEFALKIARGAYAGIPATGVATIPELHTLLAVLRRKP